MLTYKTHPVTRAEAVAERATVEGPETSAPGRSLIAEAYAYDTHAWYSILHDTGPLGGKVGADSPARQPRWLDLHLSKERRRCCCLGQSVLVLRFALLQVRWRTIYSGRTSCRFSQKLEPPQNQQSIQRFAILSRPPSTILVPNLEEQKPNQSSNNHNSFVNLNSVNRLCRMKSVP